MHEMAPRHPKDKFLAKLLAIPIVRELLARLALMSASGGGGKRKKENVVEKGKPKDPPRDQRRRIRRVTRPQSGRR